MLIVGKWYNAHSKFLGSEKIILILSSSVVNCVYPIRIQMLIDTTIDIWFLLPSEEDLFIPLQ